jgi:hypothetical protein
LLFKIWIVLQASFDTAHNFIRRRDYQHSVGYFFSKANNFSKSRLINGFKGFLERFVRKNKDRFFLTRYYLKHQLTGRDHVSIDKLDRKGNSKFAFPDVYRGKSSRSQNDIVRFHIGNAFHGQKRLKNSIDFWLSLTTLSFKEKVLFSLESSSSWYS